MPAGSDDGNDDTGERATGFDGDGRESGASIDRNATGGDVAPIDPEDGDDSITMVDASDGSEPGDGSHAPREPGESPERPVERAERDEQEWQFPLDELGDGDADESGNVAGTLATRQPVEPGDIDLENALFFLVGAVGTVLFVVLAVAGL